MKLDTVLRPGEDNARLARRQAGRECQRVVDPLADLGDELLVVAARCDHDQHPGRCVTAVRERVDGAARHEDVAAGAEIDLLITDQRAIGPFEDEECLILVLLRVRRGPHPRLGPALEERVRPARLGGRRLARYLITQDVIDLPGSGGDTAWDEGRGDHRLCSCAGLASQRLVSVYDSILPYLPTPQHSHYPHSSARLLFPKRAQLSGWEGRGTVHYY